MKNKTTIVVDLPKPRNPLHTVLAAKKGGAHRKSNKALRNQGKKDLKNIIRAVCKNDGSFLLKMA